MKIKSFQGVEDGVYALTEDGELYFKKRYAEPGQMVHQWVNIGEDIGKEVKHKQNIPIQVIGLMGEMR